MFALQSTAAADPVLPHQPSPKVGDKAEYRLTMQIEPTGRPGSKVEISEKYLIQTTQAAQNSYTQRVNFSLTHVIIASRDSDILAMMPIITLKHGASGDCKASAEGGSAESNPDVLGAIQQVVVMPEALKAYRSSSSATSWHIDFDNTNLMIGGHHLAGEAKQIGSERVADRDTIKIGFTAESPGKPGEESMKIEGYVNLDAKTGQLVHMHQSGAGMFAGGTAKVAMDVVIEGKR